ncbi:MAG: response regulator, partial [Calditrichaeota bacterium]|nr:response regulator [Calditrichota bacterium]
MKEKVLIIEDDINTLHGLGEILEDENFNISKAKNAKQALKEIENGDFDVVL